MEQGGPKQVIGEQSYGNFVLHEAKRHYNVDWALHRNSPPFRDFEEYRVALEAQAAYHPYSSPDCSALLQASPYCTSQPGIVWYYTPPQEFTLPVLFTSLPPYPPPYMYQPMPPQLAPHAKQTSFYMYPPWAVVRPTVCNIPLCLADPPLMRFRSLYPPHNITAVNLIAARRRRLVHQSCKISQKHYFKDWEHGRRARTHHMNLCPRVHRYRVPRQCPVRRSCAQRSRVA